jgi:hypothetical protein
MLKVLVAVAMLGFGNASTPVPEDQDSVVRHIERSGMPSGLPLYLQEGHLNLDCTGTLEGVEGFLVQVKNHGRCLRSAPLLQRSAVVETDRDRTQSISTLLPR